MHRRKSIGGEYVGWRRGAKADKGCLGVDIRDYFVNDRLEATEKSVILINAKGMTCINFGFGPPPAFFEDLTRDSRGQELSLHQSAALEASIVRKNDTEMVINPQTDSEKALSIVSRRKKEAKMTIQMITKRHNEPETLSDGDEFEM